MSSTAKSSLAPATARPISPGAAPARVSPTIRQLLHTPQPQPKLTVGAPNDAFEREADSVADHVMRMPEPMSSQRTVQRLCPRCEEELAAQSSVQRKCAECAECEKAELEKEEAATIRPKSATPVQGTVPAGFESRFAALRGGGQPLPASERSFFEPRFGRDFSAVRVHSGPAAGELARSVHARAFTLGRSVVFGDGEYAPGSHGGRALLAHELTHVVQQGGGEPPARVQRTVERSGGSGRDWGAALSCTVHEMFDDPEAFNAHSPPWSCCSDMALAEIRRLFETAAGFLSRTIERMERRARLDQAITAHFGPLQVWSYGTILENLRRIQPLVNFEQHEFLCRPYGSPVLGCGQDIAAMAGPGQPILLCIDSPDSETGTLSGEPGPTRFVHGGWVTVLHELVHSSGIADLPFRPEHGGSATPAQIARGEVETYRGDTGTYNYPGPFSLRNADSYARFVEVVGAESWREESESASRWVPVPGIMGGAMFGRDTVQPVVLARITSTGLGRGLQYVIPTLGVTGIWVPGIGVTREGSEAAAQPVGRGFVGGDAGLRVGVPGRVSFVFDLSTAVGARWTGAAPPELALYPRISTSLRFGSPGLGGSVGVEFGRLFSFADRAEEGWILGLGGGLHWGGSAGAPR